MNISLMTILYYRFFFVYSQDLPKPVLDESQEPEVQSDQMKIAWRYQNQNKFEVCKITFQHLVTFLFRFGVS